MSSYKKPYQRKENVCDDKIKIYSKKEDAYIILDLDPKKVRESQKELLGAAPNGWW